MKKGMTKDELFLLKFHELTSAQGEPTEFEIDRYAIGKAVGLQQHAVDTIVKHLAQANFVKKGQGDNLFLTRNGIRLVEELLDQ